MYVQALRCECMPPWSLPDAGYSLIVVCFWQVPIPAFLLTHAYFMFYHAISNVTLRRLRHAISGISSRAVRWLVQAAWIFFLSYLTALAEAVTISNVCSCDLSVSWPFCFFHELARDCDLSLLHCSFLTTKSRTGKRSTPWALSSTPSTSSSASPCSLGTVLLPQLPGIHFFKAEA